MSETERDQEHIQISERDREIIWFFVTFIIIIAATNDFDVVQFFNDLPTLNEETLTAIGVFTLIFAINRE